MPKIDLAKRRRIMQRSQMLGHCVCDPRRPCPCDVFTGAGLCPCAGERPDPIDLAAVRLTELVHNAGCASKIAPADLEAVLARLPQVADPNVLSGIPAGDDAAVYRLTDDIHLVQTVDVMTPCCDDPHTFGRICAANCLSDIYAMGGVPRTALSIVAFPAETLDGRIMFEMLRGAMETLASAGVALVGGHSIKDDEIKLGFAITGTVRADRLTERGSARVGDVLVLTKPLGSGVLTFAAAIGRGGDGLAGAIESMAQLNRSAAEAAGEVGVSACTDVTGFGLFGHLIGMVRHSGVTAEVWADGLPAFPGAIEALRDGCVPGAVERNREYVGADLAVRDGVEEARANLGFDAQTSGGLLLSVPAGRHAALLDALRARGVMGATIGRMIEESEGRIVVSKQAKSGESSGTAGSQTAAGARPEGAKPASGKPDQVGSGACCAAGEVGSKVAPSSPGAEEAFGALARAVSAGGRVDARAKLLINFALVVASRCAPCVAAYAKKAAQMGVSREELNEAAWCAVAMGGAPVRMFYLETMKNL